MKEYSAVPEFNATVANSVEPSRKVTLPVAVPLPGALAETVAVRVIGWPIPEGLTEVVRAVLVALWFTCCTSAKEVNGAVFVSPEYAAVKEWLPMGRAPMFKVA